MDNKIARDYAMSKEDVFNLIEETIKEVNWNYPLDRLILDCSDKLSLSEKEVKDILLEFDSELLRC